MQRIQQMLGEDVKQVSTNMDGEEESTTCWFFFGNPQSNFKGILLIKSCLGFFLLKGRFHPESTICWMTTVWMTSGGR
jgi:hypothetical protein